ncbi:GntR family transcriptional regulator [Psychrobacillus soli]|uniref:GntR family transcriptional regulator n=1 Tax=Psychrobacillus soli TaxID=1543965 RepID=A0A544T5M8_9BACI|nr:GntR family transcriptional regulator [Psychrobacillus soli]TQR12726.1 GntR family transcriptional regulator [Psychrobacillus soli]
MKILDNPLIRESAFNQLRKMILSQEIKPGEKLNEKEVAEQLGVSRTPVREALHKLELEGLVEIFPRRYCLVKGVTHECIREIHLIRSQLEPIAASIAVNNLTNEDLERLDNLIKLSVEFASKGNVEKIMEANDEFHQIINRASNLSRIIAILENMHDYVEAFRYSFMSRTDLVKRSIEEHQEILAALQTRDKELVKKIVTKHLEGITEYEEVILEDMKQSLKVFDDELHNK